MIYGPGQFHTQYTDDSHNASYMTVLFDMRNLTPVEQEVWYDALINRVFHYDQKINSLIKAFVRESTTGIPYMNSLMLCLLTEIIIRLLQGTYASPMNQPSNSVHKSAMDELFDRIIAYIDENIYLPLTIPEICEHFSLSRTALQLMFKNSIDQSPKKYINDKKLERIVALGIQFKFQLLCGRNHRKIDIGLDVDQPVHGKLLYIGGICRMGDQQNTDAVLHFYICITVKTIEL